MEMILKNQEFNLNVAGLLEQYHGPVTIVRRDRDDIVGRAQATGYVNHTNRLLKRLLTFRYPDIVNEETFPVLEEWLNLYDSTQGMVMKIFLFNSKTEIYFFWRNIFPKFIEFLFFRNFFQTTFWISTMSSVQDVQLLLKRICATTDSRREFFLLVLANHGT
jgi:hypothetical protein